MYVKIFLVISRKQIIWNPQQHEYVLWNKQSWVIIYKCQIINSTIIYNSSFSKSLQICFTNHEKISLILPPIILKISFAWAFSGRVMLYVNVKHRLQHISLEWVWTRTFSKDDFLHPRSSVTMAVHKYFLCCFLIWFKL